MALAQDYDMFKVRRDEGLVQSPKFSHFSFTTAMSSW